MPRNTKLNCALFIFFNLSRKRDSVFGFFNIFPAENYPRNHFPKFIFIIEDSIDSSVNALEHIKFVGEPFTFAN